jgi:hypothetical protein
VTDTAEPKKSSVVIQFLEGTALMCGAKYVAPAPPPTNHQLIINARISGGNPGPGCTVSLTDERAVPPLTGFPSVTMSRDTRKEDRGRYYTFIAVASAECNVDVRMVTQAVHILKVDFEDVPAELNDLLGTTDPQKNFGDNSEAKATLWPPECQFDIQKTTVKTIPTNINSLSDEGPTNYVNGGRADISKFNMVQGLDTEGAPTTESFFIRIRPQWHGIKPLVMEPINLNQTKLMIPYRAQYTLQADVVVQTLGFAFSETAMNPTPEPDGSFLPQVIQVGLGPGYSHVAWDSDLKTIEPTEVEVAGGQRCFSLAVTNAPRQRPSAVSTVDRGWFWFYLQPINPDETQYSPALAKEEDFHVEQLIGNKPIAEGGMGDLWAMGGFRDTFSGLLNKDGYTLSMGDPDDLLTWTICRKDNQPVDEVFDGGDISKYLKDAQSEESKTSWTHYLYKGRRCWAEYTAKRAVGYKGAAYEYNLTYFLTGNGTFPCLRYDDGSALPPSERQFNP